MLFLPLSAQVSVRLLTCPAVTCESPWPLAALGLLPSTHALCSLAWSKSPVRVLLARVSAQVCALICV